MAVGDYFGLLAKKMWCTSVPVLGRDRFASSGRGISSAGSRIVAHETIDQTETGRRWLTMFRVTWGKAPPRGKAPLPSNYEVTYASGSIS